MAEQLESVGHEHIIFNDEQQGIAVNAVPFGKVLFVPRKGERLYLPGMKEGGEGHYEVLGVTFLYHNDDDPDGIGAAKLVRINVQVEKIRSNREKGKVGVSTRASRK
jgi:hypothetical protein